MQCLLPILQRYCAVLLHKKVSSPAAIKTGASRSHAAARYMSKLRASYGYQGRGSIAVQAKDQLPCCPYSAYSASRPCKGASGVLRCRGISQLGAPRGIHIHVACAVSLSPPCQSAAASLASFCMGSHARFLIKEPIEPFQLLLPRLSR